MAFRVRKRSNIRVGRIITIITATTIGLWIGSDIIETVAASMNGSTNIFLAGFELIGFQTCGTTNESICTGGVNALNGAVSTTGILSVVGLAAFAVIVLQFVQFKF